MKGIPDNITIPAEAQAIASPHKDATNDNVLLFRTAGLLPPRGMPRCDAAFYIGCSPRMFDGMVKNGDMPSPRLIGSKKIWDRAELDDFFDALPKEGEGGSDWDED